MEHSVIVDELAVIAAIDCGRPARMVVVKTGSEHFVAW